MVSQLGMDFPVAKDPVLLCTSLRFVSRNPLLQIQGRAAPEHCGASHSRKNFTRDAARVFRAHVAVTRIAVFLRKRKKNLQFRPCFNPVRQGLSWTMQSGIEAQRGAAQPLDDSMKVLGIQLTPPSLLGLLRMLGFTLAVIAMVEVADSITTTVWANEGSVSFILGGFSGFLITECGANFRQHGWRAFALLIMCAMFLYSALSLLI